MKFLSLLTAVCFIAGCTQNKADTEKSKQEILSADKSMSELAVKEGFFIALGKFASDEFVKFGEGNNPIIGKKAFDEIYKDKPGPKTLTWQPVKADASTSGDLGYSWGNWKFVLSDTVIYGNYFTAWKKQTDGSWKMVLDGGNQTPPPGE